MKTHNKKNKDPFIELDFVSGKKKVYPTFEMSHSQKIIQNGEESINTDFREKPS